MEANVHFLGQSTKPVEVINFKKAPLRIIKGKIGSDKGKRSVSPHARIQTVGNSSKRLPWSWLALTVLA
jgi:hypothetical protein